MRNLIFGGIGIVWGLFILIYTLSTGFERSSGALTSFGVGQVIGAVFGALLLLVGGTYFVWELMARDSRHGRRRRINSAEDGAPGRRSNSPLVTMATIGVVAVVVLGFVGAGLFAMLDVHSRPSVIMPAGPNPQR